MDERPRQAGGTNPIEQAGSHWTRGSVNACEEHQNSDKPNMGGTTRWLLPSRTIATASAFVYEVGRCFGQCVCISISPTTLVLRRCTLWLSIVSFPPLARCLRPLRYRRRRRSLLPQPTRGCPASKPRPATTTRSPPTPHPLRANHHNHSRHTDPMRTDPA